MKLPFLASFSTGCNEWLMLVQWLGCRKVVADFLAEGYVAMTVFGY
jgi:hypothetical protein